jgi:DNA replication protein DnaC
MLKEDENTKGWLILHSYHIPKHDRKKKGEADFIIIIPNHGVVCVEVKYWLKPSCKNGQWFNHGVRIDSPFIQAESAMENLFKTIKLDKLKKIAFSYAVIFPGVPISSVELNEIDQTKLIDSIKLEKQDLSHYLIENIENEKTKLRHVEKEPPQQLCDELAKFLRQDFEFDEQQKYNKDEIERYTSEQLTVLEGLSSNKRSILDGAAGTGKTVMAIAAANKSVKKGNKVLFLTFTNYLSEHISKKFKHLNEVHVTTIHQYLTTVADIKPQTKNTNREYWSKELPLLALEKIIENKHVYRQYDEVIIDEAQDMFTTSFMNIIDASVKSGLKSGQWKMFGDFKNQVIYNKELLGIEEFSDHHHGVIYHLNKNCRNTRNIARLSRQFGVVYQNILRPTDGEKPERVYFNSELTHENELYKTLNKLYKIYKPNDICILSYKNDSLASRLKSKKWREKIKPYGQHDETQTPYCTIQAYKGLEAPVIIITDIDNKAKWMNNLLYIGCTRALDHVVLLIKKELKQYY